MKLKASRLRVVPRSSRALIGSVDFSIGSYHHQPPAAATTTVVVDVILVVLLLLLLLVLLLLVRLMRSVSVCFPGHRPLARLVSRCNQFSFPLPEKLFPRTGYWLLLRHPISCFSPAPTDPHLSPATSLHTPFSPGWFVSNWILASCERHRITSGRPDSVINYAQAVSRVSSANQGIHKYKTKAN